MECLQFVNNFFDFGCDPIGCFLPSQAAMTNDDDFHLSCSDLNQHLSSCKYYYPDHHIFSSRPQNSLFLLHLNVRSLNKNFSSFKEILEIFPNSPEIICISETWLKADLIKNLSIPDYTFHHSPAVVTNAGGVAMYISNKFHFENIQEYNIENANCEKFWIKLQNSKNKAIYVVGVAYRHPTSKHDDFIDAINCSIDKIAKSNQTFYLLGDFNINTAPNATNSSADKLINMLLSNNCHPLITIPTRVTNNSHTIIDNIITNDPKLLLPGVI